MSRSEDAVMLNRISDEKQKDGYSLDAQERVGTEYCKTKGFNILQSFRFVETGSKIHDRKKFDGMLKFIKDYCLKSKRALHLIVEKPDRLTRNFTNREQLQFLVMTGKLVIHFYKDRRIFDQNCSPADIFTDDIMTSVSKYMALNTAREVRKGMGEKARKGEFPGRAPLGYQNIRDGGINKHGRKHARIIPDDSTKKTVQRIFELRALKGFSYQAIRDQVVEEGLIAKERAKPFSRSSVEKILKNPFYGGRYQWEGEWYEGKHDLIVPKAWVALVDGNRGVANKPMPLGIFSHYMKCAVPGCECAVIYDPKIKINKSKGTERVYHYYHCTDGKQVHKVKTIRQVNVPEKTIWEKFGEVIASISISEELSQFIWGELMEANLRADNSSSAESEKAKVRLSELAPGEDELYRDWKDGHLSKESYTRNLQRLQAERLELEAKTSRRTLSNDEIVQRAKFTLEL